MTLQEKCWVAFEGCESTLHLSFSWHWWLREVAAFFSKVIYLEFTFSSFVCIYRQLCFEFY